MSRPVYRWRVSPPSGSGLEAVEVLAASRYDAMIAAAKLWRRPWTTIARGCSFEKLGERDTKRSCENCGNVRCALGPVAFNWDECVESKFTKHWRPKRPEEAET